MTMTTPAEIASITSDLNTREPKGRIAAPTAPIVLHQDFSLSTPVTGGTTEVVFSNGTLNIPANTIRVSDLLELGAWLVPSASNGNAKNFRIEFNGTTVHNINLASQSGVFVNKFFGVRANNGVNNVMRFAETGSGVSGNGLVNYSTVDFTVAQELTLSMQLAVGTDSVTLNGFFFRIYRKQA